MLYSSSFIKPSFLNCSSALRCLQTEALGTRSRYVVFSYFTSMTRSSFSKRQCWSLRRVALTRGVASDAGPSRFAHSAIVVESAISASGARPRQYHKLPYCAAPQTLQTEFHLLIRDRHLRQTFVRARWTKIKEVMPASMNGMRCNIGQFSVACGPRACQSVGWSSEPTILGQY